VLDYLELGLHQNLYMLIDSQGGIKQADRTFLDLISQRLKSQSPSETCKASLRRLKLNLIFTKVDLQRDPARLARVAQLTLTEMTKNYGFAGKFFFFSIYNPASKMQIRREIFGDAFIDIPREKKEKKFRSRKVSRNASVKRKKKF
jgi:hypothetical protein